MEETARNSSDENVIETLPKRIGTGLPGPGRPKGSIPKYILRQREVAAMVLGDPGTPEFAEFVQQQRKDILAGIAPPALVQMWMGYLVGKPKETIDLNANVTFEKVVREVVVLKISPEQEPQDQQQESETVDAVH